MNRPSSARVGEQTTTPYEEGEQEGENGVVGGVGKWVRLTACHNHHHFRNNYPNYPKQDIEEVGETRKVAKQAR